MELLPSLNPLKEELAAFKEEVATDKRLVNEKISVLKKDLQVETRDIRRELDSDIGAVKRDIGVVKRHLQEEIGSVRERVEEEIVRVRGNYEREIGGVKEDLEQDIKSVDKKLDDEIGIIQRRLDAAELPSLDIDKTLKHVNQVPPDHWSLVLGPVTLNFHGFDDVNESATKKLFKDLRRGDKATDAIRHFVTETRPTSIDITLQFMEGGSLQRGGLSLWYSDPAKRIDAIVKLIEELR